MSLFKRKVNLLEINAEAIKDLAITFPNALLETLAARTDIEYGIQTELLRTFNPFFQGSVIPGTNKYCKIRYNPSPKLHSIEDVWNCLYEDGTRRGFHVISYKAKIKGTNISLNIANYRPIVIKRCIDNLAKVIPKEHTSFWVYKSKNGEFPYLCIDKKSIGPIEELFRFNIKSGIYIKRDKDAEFKSEDYMKEDKEDKYRRFCKDLGNSIAKKYHLNFNEGGSTYYHFHKTLTPFRLPFSLRDFKNVLNEGKNLLGIYLDYIINASSHFKEKALKK